MTAENLARVGDVIEYGQDIPANVTKLGYRGPGAGLDMSMVLIRELHNGAEYWLTGHGEQWTDEGIERWAYPLTIRAVDPEPQPADDEPVHYVVPEFGPSGATLCGIGIEEDGNLSTTGEAGKGTCRDCRIAADEEPGGTASDAEVLQLIDERDDAHEWADRLAQAIAEFLHIDIGEHSNYNLPWQAALIALTDTVSPQPAESGPLVLTLPEVPAEAVALIGRDQQGKEVRLPIEDGRVCVHPGVPVGLGDCLDTWGPLTVEMPPPREPRTWPKLDSETYLPDAVDVIDAKGNVTRWTRPAHEFSWYSAEGMEDRPFVALRTLGDVTEVFDA